jgi:proteasome lid subunit RPN8/RPN11
VNSYFVEARVIDALREAARNADEGFEVGGRLIVLRREGWADRIVRFEKRPNHANRPGVYEADPFTYDDIPSGAFAMCVHSHPSGGALRPSASDVQYHLWHYGSWATFAIYAVDTDALGVFRCTDSARIRSSVESDAPAVETDYLRVPVAIEGRSSFRHRTHALGRVSDRR